MACADIICAQPHIDTLVGTDFTMKVCDRIAPENRSSKFGYALQHKHFEVSPGECVFYRFEENDVQVSVRAYEAAFYPCLYYTNNGAYVAVGFTDCEDNALKTLPTSYVDGIGIASPAFRRCLQSGVIELTNEKKRMQRFVSPEMLAEKYGRDLNAVPATATMIFFDGPTDAVPWTMGCYVRDGVHYDEDDYDSF